MKLPNGWKSRSKEQKAKWFSVGRVGARRIGDYDGNDFSDKWAPTVRGQIVQCPLTKVYKYENEMDAVMALNMGGDDFISKPFSLTLLDAKIAAILRRTQQFSQDDFQLDQFRLSRDGILSNGQDQIALTPTENKILTILFAHLNQVVSKEELLERLWEDESFIDQNTLSVNMTRLRKKVLPLGFDRVHTVRGVGYLLK